MWVLVQSTKILLEETVHTSVKVYCLIGQLLMMVAPDGVRRWGLIIWGGLTGVMGRESWAMSTPVPVANRALAYCALESGLRPHEVNIDRPRTVRA